MTDDLSPLYPKINARAYTILEQHGATLAQLQGYSLADLESINGIGPRWATDIQAALRSVGGEATNADEILADIVDDMIDNDDDRTVIEMAHTPMPELTDYEAELLLAAILAPVEIPDDESPLDMALRHLEGQGRGADVAVLLGQVDSRGEDAVLETAIAILEGLPGGELPRNLANEVRARTNA